MKWLFFVLAFSFVAGPTWAMKSKVKMDKAKAFFVQRPDGLYQPLDLKQRKVVFSQQDVDQCEKSMQRKKRSLKFSCVLTLPVKGENSRLTKQLSPKTFKIKYGNIVREVTASVSPNGKQISYEIGFDKTGLELDIYEFNRDFFSIYQQTAMVFFGKVIKNSELHYQILEDNPEKDALK